MGWIFLLLAGALEVGFTTTLRLLLKAPSSLTLNVIFVVLIIASFVCLQQAVKTHPRHWPPAADKLATLQNRVKG